MATAGAIGAVATIAEALITRDTPSGWASTMTVILLVSGVQSMMLGIIGEYVGRTFLSANGKPQGTVRSVLRNTAAEQDAVMRFYWIMLATAITTSMAGQTLLKAGASVPNFIAQLFDLRTLAGFVLYGGAARAVHRGAAAYSDVGGAALHRRVLYRRGTDRALRVRRAARPGAHWRHRTDLRRRGAAGRRLTRSDARGRRPSRSRVSDAG